MIWCRLCTVHLKLLLKLFECLWKFFNWFFIIIPFLTYLLYFKIFRVHLKLHLYHQIFVFTNNVFCLSDLPIKINYYICSMRYFLLCIIKLSICRKIILDLSLVRLSNYCWCIWWYIILRILKYFINQIFSILNFIWTFASTWMSIFNIYFFLFRWTRLSLLFVFISLLLWILISSILGWFLH